MNIENQDISALWVFDMTHLFAFQFNLIRVNGWITRHYLSILRDYSSDRLEAVTTSYEEIVTTDIFYRKKDVVLKYSKIYFVEKSLLGH